MRPRARAEQRRLQLGAGGCAVERFDLHPFMMLAHRHDFQPQLRRDGGSPFGRTCVSVGSRLNNTGHGSMIRPVRSAGRARNGMSFREFGRCVRAPADEGLRRGGGNGQPSLHQGGVKYMSRQRLTGKRAVWLGMLGTPALLIAAIMLIGVTAGSAGPSTTADTTVPAATSQAASGVITHTTALGAGTQTLAEPSRTGRPTGWPRHSLSDAYRLSLGERACIRDRLGTAQLRQDEGRRHV